MTGPCPVESVPIVLSIVYWDRVIRECLCSLYYWLSVLESLVKSDSVLDQKILMVLLISPQSSAQRY